LTGNATEAIGYAAEANPTGDLNQPSPSHASCVRALNVVLSPSPLLLAPSPRARYAAAAGHGHSQQHPHLHAATQLRPRPKPRAARASPGHLAARGHVLIYGVADTTRFFNHNVRPSHTCCVNCPPYTIGVSSWSIQPPPPLQPPQRPKPAAFPEPHLSTIMSSLSIFSISISSACSLRQATHCSFNDPYNILPCDAPPCAPQAGGVRSSRGGVATDLRRLVCRRRARPQPRRGCPHSAPPTAHITTASPGRYFRGSAGRRVGGGGSSRRALGGLAVAAGAAVAGKGWCCGH
jgi:hypothetical protein